MLKALRHIDALSDELGSHPLYSWIASTRHADPRRHYDTFVPILGFIMTFPFYNERFLSYDCTEGDGQECFADEQGVALDAMNALRKSIDRHAREDRTHARLFLSDIDVLALDAVWGIARPSAVLWTLWVSPRFDAALAAQSKRLRALVRRRDAWPPFRYLHIEQLEHDGNLLFSAATRKAAQIEQQLALAPIYFGDHHLDREVGHVGGPGLEEVAFTAEEADYARRIIDDMHAVSRTMNDVMYGFGRDAEQLPACGVLLAREQQKSLARVRVRIAAYSTGRLPPPAWNIRPETGSAQPDLVQMWERHHAAFAEHPFASMFARARDEDVGFALRCASLLFANRICALRALYKHDCGIDRPAAGSGAAVVQFIGTAFATEAELFFHDWDVLEMDRRIPWTTTRLLDWWFFDRTYGRPEMEALHEFRRHALHNSHDPLIAYWTLLAVHFMSRAFFAATRPLAKRFAQANPAAPPLVYLEGTHHLLYEEATRERVGPPHLASLTHVPVTDEQRQTMLRMMPRFATYGIRQFDRLARTITTDRETFTFLR